MQAAILDDDDDEDDLEDCWRDLRPGMGRFTLSDLLKGAPAYLSIHTPTPSARRARYAELETTVANDLRVTTSLLEEPGAGIAKLIRTCAMKSDGQENVYRLYMAALLHAVRSQSRAKCKLLNRVTPMGRVLEAVHDVDISPVGAFEEDFVVDALWDWTRGSFQGWGDEELSLFNFTQEDVDESPTTAMIQMRILHLLLLGGVYGLFERAILVLPDLETLVRTDLVASYDRRTRAREIDSLLEDISRWNRHFSSCLTVVLGWSGHAEDAILLRGLCEPLMQKIETSKLWLP